MILSKISWLVFSQQLFGLRPHMTLFPPAQLWTMMSFAVRESGWSTLSGANREESIIWAGFDWVLRVYIWLHIAKGSRYQEEIFRSPLEIDELILSDERFFANVWINRNCTHAKEMFLRVLDFRSCKYRACKLIIRDIDIYIENGVDQNVMYRFIYCASNIVRFRDFGSFYFWILISFLRIVPVMNKLPLELV